MGKYTKHIHVKDKQLSNCILNYKLCNNSYWYKWKVDVDIEHKVNIRLMNVKMCNSFVG